MLRGVLAGVLVTAALSTGVPAQAASPYVVYEAYAIKKNGPKTVPIRVYPSGGGSFLTSTLELKPDDDGGYTRQRYSTSWSAEAPTASFLWTFEAAAGHRYLFAAQRGRVRFLSLSGYWRVKATTIGYRTLTPKQSDTEKNVAGTGLDRFNKASLPGGRYGSMAVPFPLCDVNAGTWSFTFGGSEVQSGICPLEGGPTPHEAHAGGTWTLTGPIVGQPNTFPYLMLVFDYPKR